MKHAQIWEIQYEQAGIRKWVGILRGWTSDASYRILTTLLDQSDPYLAWPGRDSMTRLVGTLWYSVWAPEVMNFGPFTVFCIGVLNGGAFCDLSWSSLGTCCFAQQNFVSYLVVLQCDQIVTPSLGIRSAPGVARKIKQRCGCAYLGKV